MGAIFALFSGYYSGFHFLENNHNKIFCTTTEEYFNGTYHALKKKQSGRLFKCPHNIMKDLASRTFGQPF
jgi:hypothetical protein